MIERGISVNEIEESVKLGAKEYQKPHKILYHYKYFITVTKIINNEHYVITVKPRW